MRKIYSLLLMATMLLISGNTWADNVAKIGTTEYATLQAALDAAASGATIELIADVQTTEEDGVQVANRWFTIGITKSVTIDGQNHSISNVYDQCRALVGVYGNEGNIDVTIKNVTLHSEDERIIETRGNIGSITFDNVAMTTAYAKKNPTGFQLGGNQTSLANVTIKNSSINVGASGYPYNCYNPANLKIENSTFTGYCALYFRGKDSSAGSRGTIVDAVNCDFDAPNVHGAGRNAFGVFVLEDDGINITLENCGMNAEVLGSAGQAMFVLSEYAVRREQDCSLTIRGNNSHINGTIMKNVFPVIWDKNPEDAIAEDEGDYAHIIECSAATIRIEGGTYSVNPKEEEDYVYDTLNNYVPAGYEVSEVSQNGITLYRVHEIANTANSINDNVEGAGAGQNENTSFSINDDEETENEETNAQYVEVTNGATLTVATGKTLNVGDGGLVTKESGNIVVEAGATLTVGDGGTITENATSIIIEADENGSGSYLLNPTVSFNNQPLLTVKMHTAVGKAGSDYYWHRFAMPVQHIDSWTKEIGGTSATVPTYLEGWDYANNQWQAIGVSAMNPFLGYTLTYDNIYGTEVTYIFQGNLCGNLDKTLEFSAQGYNFFGNSYTAYIDAKELVEGLLGDPNIAGNIWMWNTEEQGYGAVSLRNLSDPVKAARLESWMKEVAPMQTFILQLREGNEASAVVNYNNAIWGNPRYGMNTNASAPARVAVSEEDNAFVKIAVKATNGKGDYVMLTENANYTDAYENGADATKYMNSNRVNLYVALNGENYTDVVTDNLTGKFLSLTTTEDMNYTMTFSHVEGEEYAVKDMLTGVVTNMAEGATYSFTAQPNSTVDNRFQIVKISKVVTDVENIEAIKNSKGVYTIMGQFVGENVDWNDLTTGVYVVDGVKIVK